MEIKFDGIIPTKTNLSNYIVQQHIMRYVFASKYVKDKVVLDVACGAGYGTHYLASSGAKVIYGVDIDDNALRVATTYYFHPNARYLQGNVLDLPFPDEFFDVVVSFETIEHLSETDIYIEEIKRVLKKDGIFICSTPNKKYTKHPKYHVHEFYPEEFYSLLEAHFEKVEKYAQYISIFQRLHDILNLKGGLFATISKILDIVPMGALIKRKIRRRVIKKTNNVKPIKITEDVILTSKGHEVVPLGKKRGLLRIMIGVCKYKKI